MITNYFFLISIIFLNLLIIIYFEKIKFFYTNLDNPDTKRKLHKKPTPLAGGMIVFLNLLCCLIFINFNQSFILNEIYFNSQKDLILFLVASFLIFSIGFLDDRFNLSPTLKLIFVSIVILGLLGLDQNLNIKIIKFSFLNKEIVLNNYTFFFTCFCFIVFINAFNMFDGINLQSSSYSLIIFFSILFFYSDSLLVRVLIIALICYSYLNLKNKSFLGDSGSLLISFVIGYFFIKLYNVQNIGFTDEVVIYMLIPGIDLIRIFFKRIKMKKSPLSPDRLHLHHLLLTRFSHLETLSILIAMILFPIILNYLNLNILYIFILTILIYFFTIVMLGRKNL